ncbi:hypothetical protein HOY80DRAFT_1097675 [Tuber brumale]|nr:hypothetical protein HOY80DRAFT_1097675 [Tuber brumale]
MPPHITVLEGFCCLVETTTGTSNFEDPRGSLGGRTFEISSRGFKPPVQYLVPGAFSGNEGSFNTNNIYNYSALAPSDVPATFKDLVSSSRWGVLAPEIDLDHLSDEHNWPEDGTGRWIFEDIRYKKWQDCEGSELLWLCGGPGIGKTMLAKRVAAKFLKGRGDPPGGVKLVFHFVSPELPIDDIPVSGAEPPQARLARVAWDLLYGILQQDGNLFDIWRAEFERQGDKLFTNQSTLWRILKKAIQGCPAGPVYILIDGIDGLGGDLCKELIGRILKLMDIRKVKIFLSGRDVPHISNNLREPTKINLDTNGFVKEDVKTFITHRVDKLGEWTADQKSRAIGALSAKSEGIFLWASLAIENLGRFSTGHDYQEFLGKLPSELKNVYQKMLHDVHSREGSEKVVQMIQNMALALRPLTFGEFRYILACIEENAKAGQWRSRKGTNNEDLLGEKIEIEQYVRSSLGFLRVSATTVSIVHHTAIEYLFDESRQDGLPILSKGELDLTVSWKCFQYLHDAVTDLERLPKGNGKGHHDEFRESSPNRDHPEEPAEAPQEVPQKWRQVPGSRWPYLKYAAESWFIHARRSIEIAEDKFFDDPAHNWLEHQFFDTRDTIRKPWIKLCGDPKMEVLAGDQTQLHVAVCLGLKPLVERALLDSNAGTNGTSNKQSPLHLAAKFISGAYEILIASGGASLLTAPGQYGNTPLHEAAISGHKLMLASLVKKFATPEYKEYSGQINKQNAFGDTPLHLAFQFDHQDIVEFLVENRADLTIRNRHGVTAQELGEKLGREDILDNLEQTKKIRETVEEAAEEGAEETLEDPVEGTAEDTVEETVVEPAEEALGEPVVEEDTVEVIGKPVEEDAKRTGKESGRETRDEPGRETREGYGKQSGKESGRGTRRETRKETGEDTGEELGEGPGEDPGGETKKRKGRGRGRGKGKRKGKGRKKAIKKEAMGETPEIRKDTRKAPGKRLWGKLKGVWRRLWNQIACY